MSLILTLTLTLALTLPPEIYIALLALLRGRAEKAVLIWPRILWRLLCQK